MRNSYKWSVVNVASILLIVRAYVGSATQIFTIPDFIDYTVIILGIFMCLMLIIVRKYNQRELAVLAIVGLLILVSALKSKEYTIFYTFLMILLIGDKDLKYFLKKYLRLSIFLVLLVVAIYCVKLLLGDVSLSAKSGLATFTGGYSTGNVFAFICFWLVSLYIYVEFERLRIVRTFLLCVLQFVLAYIAGCKTVMALSAINFVGLFLLKNNLLGEKLLSHVTRWMFFVVGIIYYGAIQIYSQAAGKLYGVVYVVDIFLTGRIRNSALLYDKYGFSIIGQYVQKGNVDFDEYYRLTRATIDGIYPLLFLQAGLVIFLLLSVAFFMISKKNKCSNLEMFFIIVFVFSGLSEMFVANGIICFPLLFLGRAIYVNTDAKLWN